MEIKSIFEPYRLARTFPSKHLHSDPAAFRRKDHAERHTRRNDISAGLSRRKMPVRKKHRERARARSCGPVHRSAGKLRDGWLPKNCSGSRQPDVVTDTS